MLSDCAKFLTKLRLRESNHDQLSALNSQRQPALFHPHSAHIKTMDNTPISYCIGLDCAESAQAALERHDNARWELYSTLAGLWFAEASRERCDDN